jgi:hypothetical protein
MERVLSMVALLHRQKLRTVRGEELDLGSTIRSKRTHRQDQATAKRFYWTTVSATTRERSSDDRSSALGNRILLNADRDLESLSDRRSRLKRFAVDPEVKP